MPRIFISYSRADKLFISELLPLLNEVYPNYEIFYDRHITGGNDWWQTILDAIASSKLFIYLISNESLESEYCQAEMREALRLQKPIVPVIVRPKTNVDKAPLDLVPDLRNRNWIDMSGGFSDAPASARLYNAIAIHLSQSTSQANSTSLPLTDIPTAMPEVRRHQKQGLTANQVAIIVAVLSLVGAVLVAIITNNRTSDVFFSLTAHAMETQAAAITPLPQTNVAIIPTVTPSATLEIAFIVQTLDSEATNQQATRNNDSTAAARATSYAVGTQSQFDQTATATLWTATLTPNITASIEAYRTQQAATATSQFIDDQTATAMLWTDTPIPLPTMTPIPLGFPGNPVTINSDWKPFYQSFYGYKMALVPIGCFMMGSMDGQSDEKPVNQQCFDQPFWIDLYEVTNEQYGSEGYFRGETRPRDSVTWFEARDFCARRGARLPTEREWEFAARGPSNYLYPWGNLFIAVNAIFNRTLDLGTTKVGSKRGGRSWVGAFDLSGNVWEWVSSINQHYPYKADDGREMNNDNGRIQRSLRGGSWLNLDFIMRSANRDYGDPTFQINNIGFRCVGDY
jgi:formylglycine-generating enzyme required for sulfatase activity